MTTLMTSVRAQKCRLIIIFKGVGVGVGREENMNYDPFSRHVNPYF